MNFVSEKQIEATIRQLDEKVENYTQAVTNLKEEQPAIYTYLFSESFLLLTQNERELLLYLTLVAWQSIKADQTEIPSLPIVALEEAEEKNYQLLEGVKARNFRERLNVFFENTPQEDLLALAEDALSDEDESEISIAAREPIFIAIKTIVDAFAKPYTSA